MEGKLQSDLKVLMIIPAQIFFFNVKIHGTKLCLIFK